jgi:hypothetical protein
MATIQQFDFSVDLLRAVLWQYQDATGLQSILASKAAWYETHQTNFWTNWRRDVFDLTTANEFGCAVWGVILGLSLSIGQPGAGDRPNWGFGENNLNFGNGTFGRNSAGVASLPVEMKRLLLRLRYFQLVSDGSVPHTNFALQTVFGQGYVVDNQDMTVTYVFQTALDTRLLRAMQTYDLLPRPAGVGYNIVYLSDPVWGFGPNNENFENAPFGA